MAIKDKDGNIYKLRGPNPLMKDQSEWDATKTKLINMGWKSEVIEDKSSPIKEAKANSIDIGEELNLKPNPKTRVVSEKEFIKEINEPKIEIKPEPEKEETVSINAEPRLARMLKERGVEYYCAPCVGEKTHKDDFYGDGYKTSVYGEQYIFDAIIIDQSDCQLQFWCVRPISKGSIVLRKHKEGGERWWRVSEIEAKTGGYLVKLNISDNNPDFS